MKIIKSGYLITILRYLEKRHNITNCEKVISKIEKILANITKSVSNK
jgi:hypothetical protein